MTDIEVLSLLHTITACSQFCLISQHTVNFAYNYKTVNVPKNSISVTIIAQQEGHDGLVLLHWRICKIHSYQTLQYLGIGLKHKTPRTGLKLVATVLMFRNTKISNNFRI